MVSESRSRGRAPKFLRRLCPFLNIFLRMVCSLVSNMDTLIDRILDVPSLTVRLNK